MCLSMCVHICVCIGFIIAIIFPRPFRASDNMHVSQRIGTAVTKKSQSTVLVIRYEIKPITNRLYTLRQIFLCLSISNCPRIVSEAYAKFLLLLFADRNPKFQANINNDNLVKLAIAFHEPAALQCERAGEPTQYGLQPQAPSDHFKNNEIPF